VDSSEGGPSASFQKARGDSTLKHSASQLGLGDEADRRGHTATARRRVGPSPDESDAETAQRIKQGEQLENEEARKAGLGASPTKGMNCNTATSFSGSANNLTGSSITPCHN
jgi:hypothetical protein